MTVKKAANTAVRSPFVYVGIRGSVVALQRDNGAIAWSTALPKGRSLVPIVVQDDRLLAVSGGELSCLEAASGRLIWHNPLKGYGMGFAMLAGAQDPGAVAAIAAAQAAAAAASASAAASS